MSEAALERTPGVRVTVDGQALGAVCQLKCPDMTAELLDVTPLDQAWVSSRPGRRAAGDLTVRMLLSRGDAGQARLLAAYGAGQPVAVSVLFPQGQTLGWRGWVRSLALTAAHPDAPGMLEAAIRVSGTMEVNE